jgi:hypothetical protein
LFAELPDPRPVWLEFVCAVRDIVPVASVAEFPLVMEVPLSFPVKTVPEFIAYVKANPGKVSYLCVCRDWDSRSRRWRAFQVDG